jgi:hypothetical protein
MPRQIADRRRRLSLAAARTHSVHIIYAAGLYMRQAFPQISSYASDACESLGLSFLGHRPSSVEWRKGAVACRYAVAPFPFLTHQTGHLDFPHPAFRLVSL